MINKIISFSATLFFLVAINVMGQNIFIAPNGNDINPGTFSQPMFSLASAITKAKVGDTIFVRGGSFQYNSTITISKSGTSTTKFYILSYKNERPVLDFSSMSYSSSNKGISLKSNYWHIKGLDIKGAGDNGMEINGGLNNIIEFCSFYENRDTGLQLSNGASNNQIINCDSYYNADPPNYENADGFSPKLTVGSGNYFFGCRAWNNCDDGWDGYLRPADNITTTLENCWSFRNGYLKDGSDPGADGDGNGFKLGGGDNSNSAHLMHHMILKKCVAFKNKSKGFDQNNNDGSMTLLNCSAYSNVASDYRITRQVNQGQTVTIKNSLSYLGQVELGNFIVQDKNSWINPFTVTAEDFISLDQSLATSPRKPDGSLPEITFLHLATGSDLIDAGINVGLPFVGIAPDLGAFEYQGPTSIISDPIISSNFSLNQNYPNPFNPETNITFTLAKEMKIELVVFDNLGREISILDKGIKRSGIHSIQFNGSGLSSGVYFYRLITSEGAISKRFVLLK
jgi:hypothetical protein